MEQYSLLITYATASLATLVLIIFTYHLRRPTKYKLPPGPKPLPIVGNLNVIGTLPHRSFHELSKKYGELMFLKFGSKNLVMASSIEMAKVFLKTMDANFYFRPEMVSGKYTSYNLSDLTWSNGPYWRQARKICIVELLSAKRLDLFEYIRVEEMNSAMKSVYKSSGKEIVLKDVMSTLGLNTISRMVLGKNYLDESDVGNSVVRGVEFKKMLDDFLRLNAVTNIGDWIPWMAFMDLGSVKKMKALMKKFDLFFDHVLNDHEGRRKKEGEKFVPLDMVDLLLQAADDPTLDVKIERDGVKGITLNMLTGGTETSSTTVEWVMSELLKNPEIYKHATDELDRVVGRNRWVEEKDIPNLPYLSAIIKETMRLHPGAPMLTPRISREDCKVSGYDIPKDTLLLVSIWAIGRDPNLWVKPEEFCPDRFIGKDIDMKGNHFELLPFGAGRRMCPGYNLGLKAVQSSIANLLHGFSLKLPCNMTSEDLNMDEMTGFFNPKKDPLVIVAHPRLQPEMYLF